MTLLLKTNICGKLLLLLLLLLIPVNANPTPLDHIIRLYLVYIFPLIIGQGSRPLLSIG
jgi:hypothetical protein